jgi:hypothetical protein
VRARPRSHGAGRAAGGWPGLLPLAGLTWCLTGCGGGDAARTQAAQAPVARTEPAAPMATDASAAAPGPPAAEAAARATGEKTPEEILAELIAATEASGEAPTQPAPTPSPAAPAAAPGPRPSVWTQGELDRLRAKPGSQVLVADGDTDIYVYPKDGAPAGDPQARARYEALITQANDEIQRLEREKLAATNPYLRGTAKDAQGQAAAPRSLELIDAEIVRWTQRRTQAETLLQQATARP